MWKFEGIPSKFMDETQQNLQVSFSLILFSAFSKLNYQFLRGSYFILPQSALEGEKRIPLRISRRVLQLIIYHSQF